MSKPRYVLVKWTGNDSLYDNNTNTIHLHEVHEEDRENLAVGSVVRVPWGRRRGKKDPRMWKATIVSLNPEPTASSHQPDPQQPTSDPQQPATSNSLKPAKRRGKVDSASSIHNCAVLTTRTFYVCAGKAATTARSIARAILRGRPSEIQGHRIPNDSCSASCHNRTATWT